MLPLSDMRVAARLAMRARFGSIALWLGLLVCIAAGMGAQFSGRQPATVAIDVGLSMVRLGLPVLGVLMLQELISREFDRRFFLVSLTYPRSRNGFLLGRLAALGALLGILLIVLAVALAAVVTWVGQGYEQGTPVSLGLPYWLTIVFILLDLFVVLSVGALLAVVATTPSFVLIGTLGFMLIARSFAAIVALLRDESWLVSNAEAYSNSLGLLGYVLPNLAALDIRFIALYSRMDMLPVQWPWHVGSALAYGVGFIAMALLALARKRFA